MKQQPHKGLALTELRTQELEDLLKLVYQGKLECPFSRKDLMSMGLNRVSEFGELLLNRDASSVRAILFAVLAERRMAPSAK